MAREWLDRLDAIGLDGVVAKRTDSPYLPGSRDAVAKVKEHRTADCVVVGVRWKAKPTALATLLLGLYEDDGRSNAYRRGVYALTSIVCAAEPGRVSVRIDTPSGDRSVVPSGRRYQLRLRVARPDTVAVEGIGELPHTGGDAGRAGWWLDDAGFVCVRPPDAPVVAVVMTRPT